MHADQSAAYKTAEIPPGPFEVQYLTPAEFAAAADQQILGVVAYGAYQPDPDAAYPVASTCLDPLGADCILEVWRSPDPVIYHLKDGLKASTTKRICFGSIEVVEEDGQSLEAVVQNAYDTILSFLAEQSFPAPIRFWNYLPHINADDRGMERYRRFNIGRHESFAGRLSLASPPVASALGGHAGALVIYFLGAREPAETIENPRQVSAYAYPAIYGPRRPLFSRSSIVSGDHLPYFLISGTASIVGHESRHPGDVDAQAAETLSNIRALIQEAERQGFPRTGKSWFLKIYVRHPEHLDRIRAQVAEIVRPTDRCIYLHADICRPELLVELEGVCVVS
jgi:chorismate lyase/3-hydroxybenzoate synthase